MTYDALRRGRHSLHQQAYCITTVTRNRHAVFVDFNTARLLVSEIRFLHDQGQVSSLAWVIMPDHLHWLFQLSNKDCALPTIVKTLKARSAIAINRHSGRKGSLWQRSYYDRAVRKDDVLLQTARYIVANPLRAGLVREIGLYPHWDCIWMGATDGAVGID